MENQNELRLKRENFLKRFDNVEVVIGEDKDGVEVEVVSCPVCLGDSCDTHTFKKCSHSICKDCYNGLIKTENQHRNTRAMYCEGSKTGQIYTQHFVKCPLCREWEEPRKHQLKDENSFLKKQIADLRRNMESVLSNLNEKTRILMRETHQLIDLRIKVKDLEDELKEKEEELCKLNPPPVPRPRRRQTSFL